MQSIFVKLNFLVYAHSTEYIIAGMFSWNEAQVYCEVCDWY